jgi:acylphosphatase
VETKAILVRIEGRTQGVWFRGWTVQEATRRGLRGWVRNRLDGSVEALFAGSDALVDEMVDECRVGPPAARVTNIRFTLTDDPGEVGFRVRPTL